MRRCNKHLTSQICHQNRIIPVPQNWLPCPPHNFSLSLSYKHKHTQSIHTTPFVHSTIHTVSFTTLGTSNHSHSVVHKQEGIEPASSKRWENPHHYLTNPQPVHFMHSLLITSPHPPSMKTHRFILPTTHPQAGRTQSGYTELALKLPSDKKRCTPSLANPRQNHFPLNTPKLTLFPWCVHASKLTSPTHPPFFSYPVKASSNHTHSVVYKQKGTYDWACEWWENAHFHRTNLQPW